MKSTLLTLCIVFVFSFTSCNNSGKTEVTKDSSSGPNTSGVTNVNGNLPDTSNSVNLNENHPADSSKLRDSSPVQH